MVGLELDHAAAAGAPSCRGDRAFPRPWPARRAGRCRPCRPGLAWARTFSVSLHCLGFAQQLRLCEDLGTTVGGGPVPARGGSGSRASATRALLDEKRGAPRLHVERALRAVDVGEPALGRRQIALPARQPEPVVARPASARCSRWWACHRRRPVPEPRGAGPNVTEAPPSTRAHVGLERRGSPPSDAAVRAAGAPSVSQGGRCLGGRSRSAPSPGWSPRRLRCEVASVRT